MPTSKTKMATTSARRKASKKAAATTTSIRMPTRYAKDYPVDASRAGGHNYLIREIPGPLWDRVVARADDEDLSIRFILMRLLETYADRGLGPLADPTFGQWTGRSKRR